jgi:hypothetical protein
MHQLFRSKCSLLFCVGARAVLLHCSALAICNVKEVRKDVEESTEIERRKLNLIIHGLGDEDAEEDAEMVMDIFREGLKMDFERHMEKNSANWKNGKRTETTTIVHHAKI